MKLAAFAVTMVIAWAMATAAAGAATTMAEVNVWLASTRNVIRLPPPGGPQYANGQQYVRLAGTGISGWIDAGYCDHGFLQNRQEVMLVPVLYGHGVGGTLVFTRLGGRRRFVRLISSRNQLVEVLFMDGAILLQTSIYKPNDEEGYPSRLHFERYTLRGMTLVKLNQYDTKR
jgi:hypothetical protein